MQKPNPGRAWYFVDESGDPNFYNSRGRFIVGEEGCSPILLLGFIKTPNPKPIRSALLDLQKELIEDPYLQEIPSLKKTGCAFHAKDDAPEVRYRVFRLLAELDFTAQVIVARKTENVFKYVLRKHKDLGQSGPDIFYDNVVSQLFRHTLHLHEENHIYFAQRQSKTRQAPLTAAIEQGRKLFEQHSRGPITTTYRVQAQTPSDEPCLSVIDYILWAVQRAYIKGEMRYYAAAISRKVRTVWDMHDWRAGHPSFYTRRKNPFDISKVTPLQLVPSEGHTA